MLDRSTVIFATFSLLISTLACTAPALAQPGPDPWPGLRASTAIECAGTDDMVVRDRIIQSSGIAVVADGACDLEIVGCHIVGGDIGILARGNSDVSIRDSYVRGGDAALAVRGNSDAEYSDSTFDGDILTSDQGGLDDYGGNRITGRHVTGESTSSGSVDLSGLSDLRVGVDDEDDSASVDIGPDGVVVRDEEGHRVDIGEDVRVESAVVEGHRVRARDGEQKVDVSGDWRVRADSRYAGTDPQQVLVSLNSTRDRGEIRVELAGDVLFGFDSAEIRPDAAEELGKVAHVIRREAAGEVEIVGHTDSKGSEEYNLELSQDRAFAVMRWLHRNEGIPLDLMSARGMGESQPIAHNTRPDGSDSPEGRAKNRRVTIHIETSG